MDVLYGDTGRVPVACKHKLDAETEVQYLFIRPEIFGYSLTMYASTYSRYVTRRKELLSSSLSVSGRRTEWGDVLSCAALH